MNYKSCVVNEGGWGGVASVTCVTAFINRRHPNGSAVTGDRYRMLLGNECGVLVSRVCTVLISSEMESA